MKQGLFIGTTGQATRRDLDGVPDPFGRQKDDAEYRIRDALLQFWRGQLERIEKRLAPGIPKSRKGIEDLPKLPAALPCFTVRATVDITLKDCGKMQYTKAVTIDVRTGGPKAARGSR